MISQIKQKGFTIVELLIVIVVIGILAAISIVAYNGVTQKARDDQRISDVRNIVNAASSFQAEHGTWPTKAQLVGYNTVSIAESASDRLTATAPSLPGAPDNYQYHFCNGGSGAVTATTATGIKVVYAKEDTSSVSEEMSAGSGSNCTATVG